MLIYLLGLYFLLTTCGTSYHINAGQDTWTRQLVLLTYSLPGMPLSCRPATKVLHFGLSLAIFSIVPQEWCIDFSSPSTVRLHGFFGLPRLRFPSGVQCSAVLVMEFWSLLITCPIHFQRILIKSVAILSRLPCLSRSSLEILLGQKMRRFLLKFFCMKNWQFVWVVFCYLPIFWSI